MCVCLCCKWNYYRNSWHCQWKSDEKETNAQQAQQFRNKMSRKRDTLIVIVLNQTEENKQTYKKSTNTSSKTVEMTLKGIHWHWHLSVCVCVHETKILIEKQKNTWRALRFLPPLLLITLIMMIWLNFECRHFIFIFFFCFGSVRFAALSLFFLLYRIYTPNYQQKKLLPKNWS